MKNSKLPDYLYEAPSSASFRHSHQGSLISRILQRIRKPIKGIVVLGVILLISVTAYNYMTNLDFSGEIKNSVNEVSGVLDSALSESSSAIDSAVAGTDSVIYGGSNRFKSAGFTHLELLDGAAKWGVNYMLEHPDATIEALSYFVEIHPGVGAACPGYYYIVPDGYAMPEDAPLKRYGYYSSEGVGIAVAC